MKMQQEMFQELINELKNSNMFERHIITNDCCSLKLKNSRYCITLTKYARKIDWYELGTPGFLNFSDVFENVSEENKEQFLYYLYLFT